MNAQDQWALYLDPDTHPDVRAEIASDLGDSETGALDRVGEILADEAAWGEPSAGLREQLLSRARAEQEAAAAGDGGGGDMSPATGEPVGGSIDELADRRSRRRRAGWLGGGLVAAAAAVVALLLLASPLDDTNVTTYEVAGTPLTPDLDATVDVLPLPAGVAITLNIRGLPPAEEGTYYAAWLMPDTAMADGPMVGIGSFHWRKGGIPIELWSGVDTERFPIFMVTLQDEDDPPIASDVVVMTGRLTAG